MVQCNNTCQIQKSYKVSLPSSTVPPRRPRSPLEEGHASERPARPVREHAHREGRFRPGGPLCRLGGSARFDGTPGLPHRQLPVRASASLRRTRPRLPPLASSAAARKAAATASRKTDPRSSPNRRTASSYRRFLYSVHPGQRRVEDWRVSFRVRVPSLSLRASVRLP